MHFMLPSRLWFRFSFHHVLAVWPGEGYISSLIFSSSSVNRDENISLALVRLEIMRAKFLTHLHHVTPKIGLCNVNYSLSKTDI